MCTDIITLNDIIQIVIAIIMLCSVLLIKKSNADNFKLNRLQAAENTIIKQIEFHNNILIEINIENNCGQKAFEILYSKLKKIYSTMPGNSYQNPNDSIAEENRIKDSFTQLYNTYGSSFGNYFKNLYLLITYIDKIEIKGFERDYYIDLVKSQLSKYEILLLAYDCIWIQDKSTGKNFIDFAKKYSLLSALESKELIQSISEVKHVNIFKHRYNIEFKDQIQFSN
jgi:hypothetical protein